MSSLQFRRSPRARSQTSQEIKQFLFRQFFGHAESVNQPVLGVTQRSSEAPGRAGLVRRPAFALVRGIKITDYCDQSNPRNGSICLSRFATPPSTRTRTTLLESEDFQGLIGRVTNPILLYESKTP